MMFTEETMRARFHELTAQYEALDAQLAPLRAELDALAGGESSRTLKSALAREAEIRPQIGALMDEMFPIENERALVARALKGQTGAPPADQ